MSEAGLHVPHLGLCHCYYQNYYHYQSGFGGQGLGYNVTAIMTIVCLQQVSKHLYVTKLFVHHSDCLRCRRFVGGSTALYSLAPPTLLRGG